MEKGLTDQNQMELSAEDIEKFKKENFRQLQELNSDLCFRYFLEQLGEVRLKELRKKLKLEGNDGIKLIHPGTLSLDLIPILRKKTLTKACAFYKHGYLNFRAIHKRILEKYPKVQDFFSKTIANSNDSMPLEYGGHLICEQSLELLMYTYRIEWTFPQEEDGAIPKVLFYPIYIEFTNEEGRGWIRCAFPRIRAHQSRKPYDYSTEIRTVKNFVEKSLLLKPEEVDLKFVFGRLKNMKREGWSTISQKTFSMGLGDETLIEFRNRKKNENLDVSVEKIDYGLLNSYFAKLKKVVEAEGEKCGIDLNKLKPFMKRNAWIFSANTLLSQVYREAQNVQLQVEYKESKDSSGKRFGLNETEYSNHFYVTVPNSRKHQDLFFSYVRKFTKKGKPRDFSS